MPSPAPPPHQDSHCLCRNFLSVQSLSCPALTNPSAAFLSLRKTRSSCHFFMAAVFYQCLLSIVRLHPLFVSGRVFWALWLLIDRREEKRKKKISQICVGFFFELLIQSIASVDTWRFSLASYQMRFDYLSLVLLSGTERWIYFIKKTEKKNRWILCMSTLAVWIKNTDEIKKEQVWLIFTR